THAGRGRRLPGPTPGGGGPGGGVAHPAGLARLPPDPGRGGGRMKGFRVFLALVVLIAAAGGGDWWWHEQRPTALAATAAGARGTKTVLIPPGSGPRAVANALAREGVVSDADLLYAWVRREQLGPKLKAGEYDFTLPTTPAEAIQKLVSGQQKAYH